MGVALQSKLNSTKIKTSSFHALEVGSLWDVWGPPFRRVLMPHAWLPCIRVLPSCSLLFQALLSTPADSGVPTIHLWPIASFSFLLTHLILKGSDLLAGLLSVLAEWQL